ncbi:MAG: peptide deformylase [Victivallales bacterium]|nr:peptide deformylase [Victivallales bacterium]
MKFPVFKKPAKLRIRTLGAKVLEEKALAVEIIDDEIRLLADMMIDSMGAAEGVGLAAPQVGVGIRLIVLGLPKQFSQGATDISPAEQMLLPKMPLCLVNPEISPVGRTTSISEEGCLSVPGIYAKVERPDRVMLSAQFLNGDSFSMECSGFLARAVQHEIDHLEGILFVDRLDKDERGRIGPELDKIKKGMAGNNG